MGKNIEQTKVEKEMKGKYLSPKADLTFKLVFAEHKDLMMSLLNALLPLAEEVLKESNYKKGRDERSVEIARNLKNIKIPIPDIAKATGLSVDEIESL